jgi:hypothetical protein
VRVGFKIVFIICPSDILRLFAQFLKKWRLFSLAVFILFFAARGSAMKTF